LTCLNSFVYGALVKPFFRGKGENVRNRLFGDGKEGLASFLSELIGQIKAKGERL